MHIQNFKIIPIFRPINLLWKSTLRKHLNLAKFVKERYFIKVLFTANENLSNPLFKYRMKYYVEI